MLNVQTVVYGLNEESDNEKNKVLLSVKSYRLIAVSIEVDRKIDTSK